MASGQGGAPAGAGTQDTRVQRIEEGQAGLQTEAANNSLYDANWPTYAMTPASLQTGTVGANNAILWQATPSTGGTIGNSISVALVNPGGTNPLSITISDYAVTVNLATSGGSITSTAAQVINAVNNFSGPAQGMGGYTSTGGQKIIQASNYSTSNGSGTVVAVAATNLSGGTAGTFNTFDSGLAAGVEPARQVAQVDTQWENSGLDPWASLKLADPSKW